jgi:hypothetical protein
MNDIERRDFWERELKVYVENLKQDKQEKEILAVSNNEQLNLNLDEKIKTCR